jgi:hypothetical protein
MELITNHILPLSPYEWLQVSRFCFRSALTRFASAANKNTYIFQLQRYIYSRSLMSASIMLSLAEGFPSYDGNDAFGTAAEEKYESIVEQFIRHPNFEPYTKRQTGYFPAVTPMEILIIAGLNDSVKLMLQLGVDPSVGNNSALAAAIGSNNEEIFNLLMQDQRVDPSASDISESEKFSCPFSGKTYEPTTNNPILYAARFNRLSMIERLLADSRVDASVKDYKPFRSAVKYGHIEAAKLIAGKCRVANTSILRAMNVAVKYGRADMLEWLHNSFKDIPFREY